MARRNVPPDEWTELVPSTFEDDYSIVVEDQDIYFYVGDKPAQPVAGLPLRSGAIYSGEIDRFEALYARSQTDLASTVRVVPNVRIDGSNERAVSVSTNVQTDTYTRGDDFDTSTYPFTISPQETIQELLISILAAEIEIELTTTDGDIITIPVSGPSTIDTYKIDSVTFNDPQNNVARVAGAWAGE
jgi:hypothetical protein